MSQNNEPSFPTKIRYEYQMDPTIRLQYAHGVWGGINPQGEIEISFYLESDVMPRYTERLVAPDGSFGHEVVHEDDEARTVTRTIVSRVILHSQTARAVQEWLEDKLNILDMEDGSAPLIYEGDSDLEQ